MEICRNLKNRFATILRSTPPHHRVPSEVHEGRPEVQVRCGDLGVVEGVLGSGWGGVAPAEGEGPVNVSSTVAGHGRVQKPKAFQDGKWFVGAGGGSSGRLLYPLEVGGWVAATAHTK